MFGKPTRLSSVARFLQHALLVIRFHVCHWLIEDNDRMSNTRYTHGAQYNEENSATRNFSHASLSHLVPYSPSPAMPRACRGLQDGVPCNFSSSGGAVQPQAGHDRCVWCAPWSAFLKHFLLIQCWIAAPLSVSSCLHIAHLASVSDFGFPRIQLCCSWSVEPLVAEPS